MTNLPRGWRVVCEDESILCFDSVSTRVWARRGSKPIRQITGQHQKTFLFGAVTNRKEQLFRQYKKMNHETTRKYFQLLHYRFHRFYLLIDRAPWHRKTAEKYLKKHYKTIRVIHFPTCAPDLNPVEETWRQSKPAITGNKIYSEFKNFKQATTQHFKTKKFNLIIDNYLCP